MGKMRKLSKRDAELVPLLNRSEVSLFAAIALLNSKILYRDARTLFEQESFGTARSLAISAREECGKVFLASEYLAGMITPEQFVAQLRDHKPKQAEGLIAGAVLNGLLNNPHELRKLTEPQASTVAELLERVGSDFSVRPDQWTSLLEPVVSALRADHAAAATGDHESERQAGVYVTMNVRNGGLCIEHPFEVTKEQCEIELARLGALLGDQIPADMRWFITELHGAAEPLSLEGLAGLFEGTFTPELAALFPAAGSADSENSECE
jgi:AbiV family abortive infection protein